MEDFLNCIDIIKNNAEESNIMVIGVGGGGGNAVKYMYDHGIHNVMFTICNTDAQALSKNPVPQKMQLGSDLTRGRGAGNRPERGRAAALESKDEIKTLLSESEVEMVFITAGMGGGTGTGAAPVIAEIAKELEILSVAIVTLPFRSEGPTRLAQAVEGIKEIRKHVDSLLIIDNESINSMYGDLSFSAAFGKSDDVLSTAAKGIAEIVTKNLIVNVDFADVKETMSNSGVAVMGFASAEIDDDTIVSRLTEEALESPLLNQNNISGSKKILVKVAWKDIELKMNVVHGIIAHIQAAAGSQASLIWGAGYDETLEDGHASVVVIATCFDSDVADNVSRSLLGNSTEEKKPVEPVKVVEKEEVVVKKTIVSLEEEAEEVKVVPEEVEEDFVVISNATINIASDENNETNAPIEAKPVNILSLEDEPEEKEEIKEIDADFILSPATTYEGSGSFTSDLQSNSESLSSNFGQENSSNNVKEYTAEDLEQLPAYIRRKYMLGNKTILKK
ncbi:MAG: cell division protein FtsZ [Rikenellaceae bacterium]